MFIFEVFYIYSNWVVLIAFKEKGFIGSAFFNMAVLFSIWGLFFFLIKFKIYFYTLPLLSPYPASFRSFIPGTSS